MSGIAGIVNLDGAPVDTQLLARMTGSMAFAGPDAQRTWMSGAVGFGHTLLKSTDESEHECQPFTLEGNVWVVADARVDARDTLVAELRADGQEVARDAADVELIARAYAVWQDDCVSHLLGDFSFAIWDAPRARLFCARDHLGVKPFYYAAQGQQVVFSNSIDCIRLCPSISDRLNDRVVGDLLLNNLNWDKSATTFADIQRLAPAHIAIWSKHDFQLRRYWTLPIDEPLFYPKQEDYVERFRELLQAAVADRLRTPRVSVWMSGGLDSTTLAATADRLLHTRSGDSAVRAFTHTYSSHDKECEYADAAARSLGIPIEHYVWDAAKFDSLWHQKSFRTPEPIPYPTDMLWDRTNHHVFASHSPVAFYGEGPDNALRCEWRPYFAYLRQKKLWGRIVHDLCFQAVLYKRLPLPRIPWTSAGHRVTAEESVGFPDWFQPAFEKQFHLRERWEEINRKVCSHPVRPLAYYSFEIPLWQAMFEGFQPEYTRCPLEVRHPYLDIRLLRFLLAVPALPWCRNKYLLRRSMRDVLPEEILKRPKTPLTDDPWTKHIMELGLPPVSWTPALERYVDRNRMERTPANDPARFWMDFRVRSLGYWLRNMNVSEVTPQAVV